MKQTFRGLGVAALTCALLMGAAMPTRAAESNRLVKVDLWNSTSDKASMGNLATEHNPYALYDVKSNILHIAVNPVDVGGYRSGMAAARYDRTGKGDFADVTVLSTISVDTGSKYDGTNHTVTALSAFSIALPSYLKRTGVEYVPFQMRVPYTPMDAVLGTGYLDARLRLNWGDGKETTLTTLSPDITIGSGVVTTIELHDTATGIQLSTDTTKVPEGTAMAVKMLTSGASFEQARKALAGIADTFTLYEISLIANGQAVEPKGAVELSLPYTGQPKVYRVGGDGTKTALRGVASTKAYAVLTSKLGLFAITGGNQTDAVSVDSSSVASIFSDVTNHWARADIQKAVSKGLFNGTSATTFSPDSPMTNGMVVSVLYRMADSPAVKPTNTPNVAEGAWYAKAAAWGYQQGIVGGYTAFLPEKNVTREALATMLYRYEKLRGPATAGASLDAFSDSAKVSAWARDGLAWANEAGVVTGYPDGRIAPSESASRAVVATMLSRYLDKTK